MPEVPVHAAPTNADVKPGWRSTEAWLTLAAQVLGALLYSGLFSADDPVEAKILKIGGVLLAILSALGYQAQRGLVKTGAQRMATETAIAAMQAEVTKAAIEKGIVVAKAAENPPAPSP